MSAGDAVAGTHTLCAPVQDEEGDIHHDALGAAAGVFALKLGLVVVHTNGHN